MHNNNEFKKGFIAGSAVLLFVVLAIIFGGKIAKKVIYGNASNNYLSIDMDKITKKLGDLETVVNTYYMGELDEEKVENYIYKGMIAGLSDKYASFYTKDEYEQYMALTHGKYSGIGIVIGVSNEEKNIVQSVYDDSPAQSAGIKAKDAIIEIDGVKTDNMSANEIVSAIKGSDKNKVVLNMYRAENNKYYKCEVEKENIEIQTVEYKVLDSGIGYIKVKEFDEITLSQFDVAMQYLEDNNIKGLIVDLRGNPGGLVTTVCDMLDELLPEGIIVYTEDKDGNRTDYKSDAKSRLNVPLAVLVNEKSASASEIFAGAIKDYGIGTIVGTTTYGKGIVQNIISLGDGTAMKLTVAKYFTPKGYNIHGIGIEPDIYVNDNDGENDNEDVQLNSAIGIIKDEI